MSNMFNSTSCIVMSLIFALVRLYEAHFIQAFLDERMVRLQSCLMCAYAALAFELLLMEAISLPADYTLVVFMLFTVMGIKLGNILYYRHF